MIEPLVIGSLAICLTLCYASVLDIRQRRVPFRTWYPMLVVAVPMALLTYAALFALDTRVALVYLVMAGIFCALFYVFAAYLHLFGGADAWALIFITACVPLFPIEPLFGVPTLGQSPVAFFPLSVLVNAVVLNLATPLCILVMNLVRGNRAPLRYMLVGFPVKGDEIEEAFGFVMEEFDEDENGTLRRRFIPISAALRRMVAGTRRMYTRDLKRHPEEYQKELGHYRRAGTVWISYGVPFIIPIAAGFITAFFMGDIAITLIQLLTGG